MRILGLDVGEKRIGVAKADSSTRIAVPVGYINVDGSEWRRIARIASLQGTNFFVLGLPRSNEGTETQQSLYVRNFAKELVQQIPGAKVRFQDESLTSVVAEERLKSRKRMYEKGEIDAEAATIILQDFLEGFQVTTLEPEVANMSTAKKSPEDKQAVKDLAKKEADKIKLNTKKVKHKMKTSTKLISMIAALVVIIVLAVGGFMLVGKIKDERAKARAEEYARLEAEMRAEVFTFTIRPGETIFDIRNSLVAAGFSETETDEALNAQYNFAFLQGRPEGATLEGYLYGETHEFYADTSAKEVIETYLKGTETVINENNLEAAYAAQGLSLYEGITLASIVQKEAAEADMPTVAQVFLTRLAWGTPLGSDVTVSYALDKVDPNRQTYTDNTTALTIDSCYNTRLYGGLPCGPISNPGLSALLAVANPSDTSYLYFLTGDDGLMYYSYTEAEHIQNTYSHCQSLCNVSL